MINIKTYSIPKTGGTGGTGGGGTTIVQNITNTITNDWFYFDAQRQCVVCKYDLVSVGNVAAYANSGQYVEPEYIIDGLVFELDGMNKGSTADSWTDLIGGLVFTNNGATSIPNGWMISNSSSNNTLRNSDTINWDRTTSTIEVVYSTETESAQLIFSPSTSGSITMGLSSGSQFAISNESSSSNKVLNSPINIRGTHTVSLNINCGVIDINNSMTVSSENLYFESGDYNDIGGMSTSSTNSFNGNIYAIRIYNRLLTEQEMTQNQRVDNVRFGLGL